MATLSITEKEQIVAVVAHYDPKTKEAYEQGDLTYHPRIADSLELADLQLAVEAALGWEAIDFEPWGSMKVHSPLSTYFSCAEAVKTKLFG